MNMQKHLSLILSLAISLAFLSASPILVADDTDIYLGGGSLTGNSVPNIVYVIDTSGSMGWDAWDSSNPPLNGNNLRGNTFDPVLTPGDKTDDEYKAIYPSANFRWYNGYCQPNRYYWLTLADYNAGKIPDCKTGNTQYIDAASFHCNDALAVNLADNKAVGVYSGRFAKLEATGWGALLAGDNTSDVECAADFGKHGTNTNITADPDIAGLGGISALLGTPGWVPHILSVACTTTVDWSGVLGCGAAPGGDYVFFTANYVNWYRTDRMTTVMDVYVDLLTGLVTKGTKLNVGLMRYDRNAEGGYFIAPFQEVTPANLQTFIDAVLALRPDGSTPLGETYYEAYRFYNALSTVYGETSTPATNPPSMYSSGTTYASPITNQCQKNFVILLTDGDPRSDTSANSAIETLTNTTCGTKPKGAKTFDPNGACMDELADYMNTHDCSSSHSGTQNVYTYSIAFGNSVSADAQTLLTATANKGGGAYFTSSNASELVSNMAKIILDINRVASIFTAPTVSVNSYNRNFHSDMLYYALFQPEAGPVWYGNLKSYKLVNGELRDATLTTPPGGNPVVDPLSGTILPSAMDFWTDPAALPAGVTADGEDIRYGGAASRIPAPANRKAYTYTASTAPVNADLTAAANRLTDTNASITTTMLGLPVTASTTLPLQWAKGVDVLDANGDGSTTDARLAMGDPLHTKPWVINYGGATKDDLVIYATTNEGYLHAIDAKNNGTELFAFMPQELLPNIYPRMTNGALSSHIYGLDGALTIWHNDLPHGGANPDGVLYDTSNVLEPGEFAYLYVGMRRGGYNYYALDVTDRTVPKLKWEILGGPAGTKGFDELGQTWSAMTKAKVKINGTIRDVLVFGGGYDIKNDTAGGTYSADTIGRSIYMVDAVTGEKLWQAGPTGSAPEKPAGKPDLVLDDMTNCFPTDIVIFDSNFDNLDDRIYAVDISGQIWRFDIDNVTNSGAADLATGGMIAQLHGTTAATNLRFYNTPAVSLSGDKSYLAIAVGSGQRSNPKDITVEDAMFYIRDPYVFEPPKDKLGKVTYKYVDTTNDGNLGDAGDSIITWGTGTQGPPYTDPVTNKSTTTEHLYNASSNILGTAVNDKTWDGITVNATTSLQEQAKFEHSYGWFVSLYDVDASNTIQYVGEKVTSEATLILGQLYYSTFTPVEKASAAVCAPNMGRGRIYAVQMENAKPIYDKNLIYKRVLDEPPGMPGQVQTIITTDGVNLLSGLNQLSNELSWAPRKNSGTWYTDE